VGEGSEGGRHGRGEAKGEGGTIGVLSITEIPIPRPKVTSTTWTFVSSWSSFPKRRSARSSRTRTRPFIFTEM
jgi:hypothetical protein